MRDVGGVFASDAHRRVLGHLSHPGDGGQGPYVLAQVVARIDQGDVPLPADVDIRKVLADLVKDGHAERDDNDGYVMTRAGFDAITGPIADEPPPLTRSRVEALVASGDVTKEGFKAWESRHGQEASA